LMGIAGAHDLALAAQHDGVRLEPRTSLAGKLSTLAETTPPGLAR
jgi:hypothetical protein